MNQDIEKAFVGAAEDYREDPKLKGSWRIPCLMFGLHRNKPEEGKHLKVEFRIEQAADLILIRIHGEFIVKDCPRYPAVTVTGPTREKMEVEFYAHEDMRVALKAFLEKVMDEAWQTAELVYARDYTDGKPNKPFMAFADDA